MSTIQPATSTNSSQLISLTSVAVTGLSAQTSARPPQSGSLARQESVPATQSSVPAAAGPLYVVAPLTAELHNIASTYCPTGNRGLWRSVGLDPDQLPSSQPLRYDASFHGPSSAERE